MLAEEGPGSSRIEMNANEPLSTQMRRNRRGDSNPEMRKGVLADRRALLDSGPDYFGLFDVFQDDEGGPQAGVSVSAT